MASDLQPGYNVTASFPNSNIDGNSSSSLNGSLPYDTYHHHHHHHHHINVAGVLVGILLPHAVCTLFVLGRAWSRLVLLRKWFLDDSLLAVAWLCSTAVCVVYSIAAVTAGKGAPRAAASTVDAVYSSASAGSGSTTTTTLSAASTAAAATANAITVNAVTAHHSITTYLLRTYLGLIFYQLCLCLTKLSILTLYLRIFAAAGNRRARACRLAWLTIGCVVAYGIPLLWMSIMQCHPASAPGGPALFFNRPVALCFSFTPLLVASATLHTVTDAWLILLVVPFVLTRPRGLPTRQRRALAAVLSLGVFVVAASLTRLQLSLHANYRPSGSGVPMSNTLGFFVMTILECDIALICASAPTLRPLLARMAPRWGLGEDAGGSSGRRRASSSLPQDERYYHHQHHHHHHLHRRSFYPRRLSRLPFGPHRVYNRDDDEDSEDLTSVVSYHGYPWTRTHTPVANRSKMDISTTHAVDGGDTFALHAVGSSSSSNHNHNHNNSSSKDAGMPNPPAPTAVPANGPHNSTPTTLSLRHLVSGIAARGGAPRSRGGLTTVNPSFAASDKNTTNADGGGGHADHGHDHDHDNEDGEILPSGTLTRRPSSVLFENSDYEQYFRATAAAAATGDSNESTKPGIASPATNSATGTPASKKTGIKRAGVPGAGIGLGIILRSGNSRNGSQESFVMGLNDPASPTRLTRLTGISGYSGETYTEERQGGGKYDDDDDDDKNSKHKEYDPDLYDHDHDHGHDHDHNKDKRNDRKDDGDEPITALPHLGKMDTSFLDDDTDMDDEGPQRGAKRIDQG
ncbi:integral membrane protein [Niveomyces insectorum RCEF 264]|uniref:Integral membrane protein n=1 Tax=Niveomyces insectorum RCEF 264 TaxID=1081102 RepID=A0A167M1J4_9HYPO|nr:integral membrane protein [Niveomyces insectorum RCEF 264]